MAKKQSEVAPATTEPTNGAGADIITEPLEADLYAAVEEVPMLAPEYPALAQVYDGVPADVIETCERARQDLHDTYIYALNQVHKALAPYGRFKEWCTAVGLNYGTVCNRLSRANSKQEAHNELTERLPQPTPVAVQFAYNEQPSLKASARPHHQAQRYRDASIRRLCLGFYPDDYERVLTSLQRVVDSQHLNSREDALLYVLDAYEGRTHAEQDAVGETGEASV